MPKIPIKEKTVWEKIFSWLPLGFEQLKYYNQGSFNYVFSLEQEGKKKVVKIRKSSIKILLFEGTEDLQKALKAAKDEFEGYENGKPHKSVLERLTYFLKKISDNELPAEYSSHWALPLFSANGQGGNGYEGSDAYKIFEILRQKGYSLQFNEPALYEFVPLHDPDDPKRCVRLFNLFNADAIQAGIIDKAQSYDCLGIQAWLSPYIDNGSPPDDEELLRFVKTLYIKHGRLFRDASANNVLKYQGTLILIDGAQTPDTTLKSPTQMPINSENYHNFWKRQIQNKRYPHTNYWLSQAASQQRDLARQTQEQRRNFAESISLGPKERVKKGTKRQREKDLSAGGHEAKKGFPSPEGLFLSSAPLSPPLSSPSLFLDLPPLLL